MSLKVIYHRADFDGIFSREIARRHFGDGASYIGWDYGDPVPEVQAADVIYMIDISIEPLMGHANLIWIDHHKSAIEKYGDKINGWRIDGVAACRLAWRWFNHTACVESTTKEDFIARRVEEPPAVTLAGEYDVWDKRDPRAEVFQHGLRSCEPDFGRLLATSSFADEYLTLMLRRGELLQFARHRENESIIKAQGFTVQFEGLTFIACNAARFNSLLFTAALRPEHDGCLGFCWDGGKAKWKVSLYGVPGKPDVDLAAIAVRHGGGGHKQACGFECLTLPFDFAGNPFVPRAIQDDPEVLWILGQPCFAVRHVAETLRLMGQNIPTKSEAEQAHALLWELNLWLKHGDQWRAKAQLIALGAIDAAKAKQAIAGGAP